MGHRAVERVRRNFTVDRDVERTLDMYALLGDESNGNRLARNWPSVD